MGHFPHHCRWKLIKRISSKRPTSSADLSIRSSFSHPQENDWGNVPNALFPTPEAFSVLPQERDSNPLHFHFPEVLPCVV